MLAKNTTLQGFLLLLTFGKSVNTWLVGHQAYSRKVKKVFFPDFQCGLRSSRSSAYILTVVANLVDRALSMFGATRGKVYGLKLPIMWPFLFPVWFQSSLPTADLLTVLSDKITRTFNRFRATKAVTLNRSWAIDTVWYAGQIHKLQSYGVSGQVFSLVLSFVSTELQIKTGQRSITANIWPLTAYIYHVMIFVTGGFSKKCFLSLFPRKSFEQSWICYLGI